MQVSNPALAFNLEVWQSGQLRLFAKQVVGQRRHMGSNPITSANDLS